MVTPGSFPELTKILSVVHSANPITDEDDDNDEEDWEDDDDEERMRGLPGIPGEARVTMLSDEAWQRLRDLDEPSTAPTHVQPEETDGGDDWQEEQQESEADNVVNKDDDDGDQISLPALPPVHRQTFVFSATLTLPKRTTTATKRKDGKKARAVQDVDGAIAEILEKARAVGPTKIVDLTKGAASNGAPRPTSSKSTTTDASSKATDQFGTTQFRLPPGLKLQQIKCTQMHKDSHLYAYLMTTVSGSAGPCLVFCNSIAAVRRVSATLQTLGLPVRMLHAHMQQVRCVMIVRERERVTMKFAKRDIMCSNDEKIIL